MQVTAPTVATLMAMSKHCHGAPRGGQWRDPDSNRPDDVPGLGTDATTGANGETRTRTGDTTVFSRVLYQLSYLALRGDAIGCGARRIARGTGKLADLVSTLPECAGWACSRSL